MRRARPPAGRASRRAASRRARAGRRACGGPPGSGVKRLDLQHAAGAVGLQVGAADEPVAEEQRQDVVAVDALVLALVHLDQVVEAEQPPEERPVPHQVVERAEEHRRSGGAVDLGAGGDEHRRPAVVDRDALERPSPTSASTCGRTALAPPAKRQCSAIPASVSAPRPCDRPERVAAPELVLGRRRRLERLPRDHALGQVVDALEALPAGDRDLARRRRGARAPAWPASSPTSARCGPRRRGREARPRREAARAPRARRRVPRPCAAAPTSGGRRARCMRRLKSG